MIGKDKALKIAFFLKRKTERNCHEADLQVLPELLLTSFLKKTAKP